MLSLNQFKNILFGKAFWRIFFIVYFLQNDTLIQNSLGYAGFGGGSSSTSTSASTSSTAGVGHGPGSAGGGHGHGSHHSARQSRRMTDDELKKIIGEIQSVHYVMKMTSEAIKANRKTFDEKRSALEELKKKIQGTKEREGRALLNVPPYRNSVSLVDGDVRELRAKASIAINNSLMYQSELIDLTHFPHKKIGFFSTF